MRSPYQSPTSPPARRFLRRIPPENRERRRLFLLLAGAVSAFLAYVFVFSDTGLLRILTLRSENDRLRQQKLELAIRANALDRRRQERAKDPLLEERIARERFHLVREGEIVYRYKDPDNPDR